MRTGAAGAGDTRASCQEFSNARLTRLTTVAKSASFSIRGAAFFAARAELIQKPAPTRSRIKPDARKKRQRTAALQDAGAFSDAPLPPQGFGVRLSSAAFWMRF